MLVNKLQTGVVKNANLRFPKVTQDRRASAAPVRLEQIVLIQENRHTVVVWKLMEGVKFIFSRPCFPS